MNIKTTRRLSPASFSSNTLFASLPLALAALVAQGCGDGNDKTPADGETAASSSAPEESGTGSSDSAPSTTSSGEATGSAETGSGSSEEAPGEEATTGTDSTGEETKSDETKSDETKSDETKSDETKTDETNTEESTSGETESTTGTQDTDSTTGTQDTESTTTGTQDTTTTTGTDDSSSTDSTSSDSTDSTSEGDTTPGEAGDDKVKLTWFKADSNAPIMSLGINPVKPKQLWMTGPDGTLLYSKDGAESWTSVKVSDDAEDAKLDFRDVHVTGGQFIYLLTRGEGEAARIYRSVDGGSKWVEQFRAKDPKASFNCMAFNSSISAFAFGDAIDKKHYMVRMFGPGTDWRRLDTEKMPEALENEGGFSTGGACNTYSDLNTLMAVTAGAKTSRLLKSTDNGVEWKAYDVPLATQEAHQGLTSLVMWSQIEGLVFAADMRGGDLKEAIAYTKDGGETWEKRDFSGPKGGFFGAASNQYGAFVIAVGPSGMYYSTDKGSNWTKASSKALRTVTFAKDNKTAYAAGDNGTVVRIELK